MFTIKRVRSYVMENSTQDFKHMQLGKHILSSAKHRDHIDLMKFSTPRWPHVIYGFDSVEEMYELFREIRLNLRVAQGETFGA